MPSKIQKINKEPPKPPITKMLPWDDEEPPKKEVVPKESLKQPARAVNVPEP